MPKRIPTLSEADRDVRAAKEQIAAIQKQVTEEMLAAAQRYKETIEEAKRVYKEGVREFNRSIMGAKSRVSDARRLVWESYRHLRAVKSYLFEMGISPRYPGEAEGEPQETERERQLREEADKFLKSRGI